MVKEVFLQKLQPLKIVQNSIMQNFIPIITGNGKFPQKNQLLNQEHLYDPRHITQIELAIKTFLSHLLQPLNSAFCISSLLSAPGTLQTAYLFSHLAPRYALKIGLATGRLQKEGENPSSFLGFPSATCACVSITTATTVIVLSYGRS